MILLKCVILMSLQQHLLGVLLKYSGCHACLTCDGSSTALRIRASAVPQLQNEISQFAPGRKRRGLPTSVAADVFGLCPAEVILDIVRLRGVVVSDEQWASTIARVKAKVCNHTHPEQHVTFDVAEPHVALDVAQQHVELQQHGPFEVAEPHVALRSHSKT